MLFTDPLGVVVLAAIVVVSMYFIHPWWLGLFAACACGIVWGLKRPRR